MKSKTPNKLIAEKSPYLLQHAHNPVNWYPWGTEAFQKAKAEDKPVFLSIGYSTCHWCHVMEEESFEDEEVAALLNEHFVSIKVDREERPDIDAVYMAVCQSITGSGGWPLTIIMTPDQQPFFAATYLPKESRYGMPGLMDLLPEIVKHWHENKDQLIKEGNHIAKQLQSHLESMGSGGKVTKELLQRALNQFENSFDGENGGFGRAPKFPAGHNLLFLLTLSQLEQDENAFNMAEFTLLQMAKGGIFDHIGGGFARYSTDNHFLVPHFEKMLYDNALLLMAYAECYSISKAPFCKSVAEKTANFVLAEMTHAGGAFFSAQDADSDGEEGKYYVFTPDEIINILGEADGKLFCQWFNITPQGNFEGKSIPNRLNQDLIDDPKINALAKKVYEYRKDRTRLHTDDKILTAWNALMIQALTFAGRKLQRQEYIQKAMEAESFLSKNLSLPNGRLMVRWRDGEAAHNGQLDDYAFCALALIELYHATFNPAYLQRALELADIILSDFADNKGGYYIYSDRSEALILRPKELYDGAMPSGNSAAAMVFVQLWLLTAEQKWQRAMDGQLEFLAANIADYPRAHSYALLAMTKALYPAATLVCTSADNTPPTELLQLQNEYENLTVLFKNKDTAQQLSAIAPFTAQYATPLAGTVYYLCFSGACTAPTKDISKVKQELDAL